MSLALTALLVPSSPVSAGVLIPQDKPVKTDPERPAGQGRADSAGAKSPELRDETFRLMDAYLLSNLQESLDLSDEQFARVLPLVKRLQSDRREFATRRMQALRALRRTLNSGRATEAGVADLLRDLKKAVADERSATLQNLDALDAELTPLQQAKYRVFEAEVDVRLRRLRERTQNRNRPNLP